MTVLVSVFVNVIVLLRSGKVFSLGTSFLK